MDEMLLIFFIQNKTKLTSKQEAQIFRIHVILFWLINVKYDINII